MLPDFSIESTYGGPIVAMDEAGRGPLAGPVVAAAVMLAPHAITEGINDSKKLTTAKREALFHAITASAKTAVGMANVEEIDRLNILHASLLAMQRAYDALGVEAQIALIDGNKAPILPCPTRCIVRGDAISLSIAAASIIAKVTRDRIMASLAREYPFYGWETNAGYGTKAHHEGMAKHGITPHHRKSFAPVRQFLIPAGEIA